MIDDKIINLIKKYDKKRPEPNRNLDQFWADNCTIVKRAKLLADIEKIENKSILFLGDDDLGAISLGAIVKAKNITVIDIDRRILNFISTISSKEKMNINCFFHDLRHPLPKNMLNNYDIVFFDPAYTPSGVNNWLNRALEASLGKGSNKNRKDLARLFEIQYFLCYGYTDRSRERGLKIQQIISSLGLVIQEKFQHFNKYYRAESINSTSDLYILQPTPKVNIRKLDIARSRFYTGHKIIH